MIAWQGKRFRDHGTKLSKKGRPGRPLISNEIKALIRKMSGANVGWVSPRIVGELRQRGIEVSKSTVEKYRVRSKKPPSPTIYHLRKQSHRRIRRILSSLERIDIFHALPLREVKALAASIQEREYTQGTLLYQQDDPANALYIVADGVIELLDPAQNMACFERLTRNMAFGRMAFLTGTPHVTVARALTDTSVWVIPKIAFVGLLPNSPILIQAVHRWLRAAGVISYLTGRHNVKSADARAWCDSAVRRLYSRGELPEAVAKTPHAVRFASIADQIERVRFFAGLPSDELARIAECLVYTSRPKGHTFFHHGELADRLYIIDQGEVSLIDPTDRARLPTALGKLNSFGVMACLNRSKHSVSAIASEDTTSWVLRRSDLERLLAATPEFAQRIRSFVQRGDVSNYLTHKQHFDTDKAERWIRAALKSVGSGHMLPEANAMSVDITAHKGAPPALFAVAEGMAAGAMLTMIAQTMLPEAYFKGGSIIGLATLLGFLAAISIKVFE